MMKNKMLVVIFAFLALTGSGFSQTSTRQDTLRELMRRIDILTEELENRKLGEVARREYVSKYGMGPAASQVYSLTKTGVSLAGYGEIVLQLPSSQNDNGDPSNKQNEWDYLRNVLYTGFRFGDRFLFNAEIEFEHAKAGDGAPGEVAMEFGYLEANLSPRFNLRAGMVLVPVGILNEFHESATYLSVHRPDTERDIIPTTWRGNGGGLVGETSKGIGYKLYVLEGLRADKFTTSGIRSGRQNGAKAIAENLAVTGQLYYAGMPGLNLGVDFYSGRSGQGVLTEVNGGSEIAVPTTIASVHGIYQHRGLWLRALYARSWIGDVAQLSQASGQGSSSVGERQFGYYITAGYEVFSLLKKNASVALYPFVQYERLDSQAQVPEGFERDLAQDRTNWTFGATCKPHPNIALKLDYLDRKNAAGIGIDQWNLAFTYMF